MTASGPTEQQWEQPSFEPREPRPFVTGPVLLPMVTRVAIAPPTQEEQRLRTIRAFSLPLAIVVGVLTGSWFAFFVLLIAVNAITGNRLRELRRQRFSSAQLLQ